ncbi:hypothetical protein [Actinosynnema sp. NPDC020468]|uniref:hypothetical protein n=1 Tax=Actinosynnema sp. NPDC020468 TaxID=3154488 RepID=UPI003409E81B
MRDNGVWVRLHVGWEPGARGRALAWTLWQPGYRPESWPTEELRPSFVYYVCEDLAAGGRGLVARATVTSLLNTAEAPSAEEAYRLVADNLFDDDLAIPPDDWHSHRYNKVKADAPWPQRLTAWRIATEPFGPQLLPPGRMRFPRSGWLRTAELAL